MTAPTDIDEYVRDRSKRNAEGLLVAYDTVGEEPTPGSVYAAFVALDKLRVYEAAAVVASALWCRVASIDPREGSVDVDPTCDGGRPFLAFAAVVARIFAEEMAAGAEEAVWQEGSGPSIPPGEQA